ncbi:MAG: sel1 repeat family protein [Aquipseudomonas alcaligenes]|uniref:Sel1 repeat family protein n=1 Tax=Aquipseudomonas alcaligenes TaxID=43263 RepID=A0A5C7WDJ7_AQUAC|nr:MAG: sel1 repeat family protein [Pseudomonas alcaligenes]
MIKHEKAAYWYGKAADQGSLIGQANLGRLYEKGRGVPQDHFAAKKLYIAAVKGGMPAAQYNLGRMYEKGIGTSKDLVLAYALYSIAIAREHPEASYARQRLALEMSEGDRKKAQGLAYRILNEPEKVFNAHDEK